MRLNEVSFGARPPIEGYGPGHFRIAGATREGALLHLPGGLSDWRAEAPLGAACFAPVLAEAAAIDVLLIGLGAQPGRLPPEAAAALDAAGLRWDALATPAACRSFNVLLAEGRAVAAALLPV